MHRTIAYQTYRHRHRLGLEELIAQRSEDREEAMFNLGYEHGLLQGRTDAMSALWRKSTRGRAFAGQIGRLAVKTGLDKPQAVAALLEIAWSLSIPRRCRGAARVRERRGAQR